MSAVLGVIGWRGSMKKRTVYLVVEETSNEYYLPLRVFDNNKSAIEFKKKCDDYHAKAPRHPYEAHVETPESDKVYVDYFSKLDLWAKKHPAGEDSAYCDNFIVREVPMYSK